ncbi:centrosomal protein of 295 kDa isoform X2 [Hyperolius riggenbachi]|uniref:centrosomal protein of 295 kDa isoform X2 n=1 Tax=Hyperolius riggenbachi TaxID=752182 RepID=UPI0035A39E64
MYTGNMKRKVAKVPPLRLSPNEEALILKQERERRRKLRLQQVREQEKFIAQQIRHDVQERRDQQLQHLAEELRAKWEADQAEKLRALERVYLSTLSAIGEGHRQAKENEPDLKAIERTVALNKEKAEKRHREALKDLKQHREKQLRQQTWHIKARRKALVLEKERAAKVASLPPPPPDPLESLELGKKPPLVKLCDVNNFSVSHYHLPEAYVDREMDTQQCDARAAAAEEGKRLGALQKEEERDRREQMEKATLRGSYALRMVQLTQDRDRLMKEMEQMQQEDLTRRRQTVSQMPQQLFEPGYRRAEIREEWQRDLETAFEDMYTRDTKMRGDMVLHLKPQPLPDPSVTSVDEDLDLSVEPEAVSEWQPRPVGAEEASSDGPQEAREPQSRVVLKKLLNRIRTQKDQWSAKSDAETASETLESGSLPAAGPAPDAQQEGEGKSDAEESKYVKDSTVVAGKSVLLHPQEEATRIRMETERKKRMEGLERQKMEQLELLKRLEEERGALEEEYSRMQLHMQEARRRDMEQESSTAIQEEESELPASEAISEESPEHVSEVPVSPENVHIQMIRDYQQRLIEQNRLHKQSVDEARKRLQEYQLLLKKRYPHLSTSRQDTSDRSLEITTSPKPTSRLPVLEYTNAHSASPPPTSPPGRAVTIPSAIHNTYITPTTGKRPSQEEGEQNVLQTTRKLEPEHLSQRNLSNDGGPVLVVDSHRLGDSIRSLHEVCSPGQVFEGESPSQEPRHRLESQYQKHDDDYASSPHTSVICDKQSSISSPGEYETSSSTTYHPLPSELSLGLPPADYTETAIPLAGPSVHVMDEDHQTLGDFSSVREFREKLLSSTAEIQAQQEHLKAMQDQLDRQRDTLMSKQKSHEQHLLEKHKQLEEQMRRHRESLEEVLGSRELEEDRPSSDFSHIPKEERYQFMSALLKALEDSSQEELTLEHSNDLGGNVRHPQRWRPSKPPVTKTKLGPFLEQHELSAILEVETPTSGRRSSAGLADSSVHLPIQDGVPPLSEAPICQLDTSKNRTDPDTGHRELDLSAFSSSSMDRSSDRSKLSWREMLSLSRVPSHSDHPHTPAAFSFPTGGRAEPFSDLMVPEGAALPGAVTHGLSPEAIGDYLSTTTLSTGSFLTSEKADSSPANSDALSDLQRCNYSAIREAHEGGFSPSAANREMQPDMRWRDYLHPAEERSHIQQIIDKYTKDLSVSLQRSLSFRSPEAALDISATDSHFPTTFYPLDPKPDCDLSSSSFAPSVRTGSSPYIGDVSQGSRNTSSRDQLSHRSPSVCSSAGITLPHSTDFATRSPGIMPEAAAPEADLDRSATDSHFTTSFYPLDPKPDNDLSSSSFAPSVRTGSSLYMGDVSQGSRNTSSGDQPSHRSPVSSVHSSAGITLPHSTDLARRSLSNVSEATDSGCFLPLHPESTLNGTRFSNQHEASHPILTHGLDVVVPRDSSSSCEHSNELSSSHAVFYHTPATLIRQRVEEDTGSFHELMATKTTENDSELSEHPISYLTEKNNSRSVHFEELPVSSKELHSDGDSGTAGNLPSPQEPDSSVPPGQDLDSRSGTVLDSPNLTPGSESLILGSYSGSSLNYLSSLTGSSAHSLPSCVCTWDSSSAHGILEEPDLTLLSLNDSSIACSEPTIAQSSASDPRWDSSSIQSNFKPLPAEVDTSGVVLSNQSSIGTSLSQHFADTVQAEVGQLKKVVEVRVSTPEERRLSEVEMHQRTVRLYNRLGEVKTRREEKMRQEAYAKNREKAREFKKRTLEKLRASKMK